jgi:hypothetical protein
MYSHVFCFRFEETASQAARMRFLAELFELPEKNGERASDVYWCFINYDGFVEFYSNTPKATELFDKRLQEAQANGTLKQVTPGLGSTLRFLSRLLGGLLIGVVKLVFRRRR